MQRRVPHHLYQQFLESFFSNPIKNTTSLGRAFLAAHFPGIEDPDVTEEEELHRCTQLLEERYVQPLAV